MKQARPGCGQMNHGVPDASGPTWVSLYCKVTTLPQLLCSSAIWTPSEIDLHTSVSCSWIFIPHFIFALRSLHVIFTHKKKCIYGWAYEKRGNVQDPRAPTVMIRELVLTPRKFAPATGVQCETDSSNDSFNTVRHYFSIWVMVASDSTSVIMFKSAWPAAMRKMLLPCWSH